MNDMWREDLKWCLLFLALIPTAVIIVYAVVFVLLADALGWKP